MKAYISVQVQPIAGFFHTAEELAKLPQVKSAEVITAFLLGSVMCVVQVNGPLDLEALVTQIGKTPGVTNVWVAVVIPRR